MSTDPWHSGLQLRVIDGPGLNGVTDLDQPRLAIGRSRGAPGERATGWVFLEDRSVSRQHAELVWDDDAYRLLHLSQTNLTWVNGDPVTDRRLVVGDVVKIGPVQLVLEKAPVKAPPEPPPAPEKPAESRPVSPERPRPSSVVLPPLSSKNVLMLTVGDKSIALDGHFITIGRDNQQLEPTEQDPRVFDLLLELSDPDFHPNHLILKSLESGGFEVFRNPGVPPVKVQRTADGLQWEAWLLDVPAHLKAGDSLTVGATTLRLQRQEDAAPAGPRRVTL